MKTMLTTAFLLLSTLSYARPVELTSCWTQGAGYSVTFLEVAPKKFQAEIQDALGGQTTAPCTLVDERTILACKETASSGAKQVLLQVFKEYGEISFYSATLDISPTYSIPMDCTLP